MFIIFKKRKKDIKTKNDKKKQQNQEPSDKCVDNRACQLKYPWGPLS
jgi:hypothetical protein